MDCKKISIVSGAAALLALTAAASAGPMSITGAKLIAPPQARTEPVHYRYYGHDGWVPGAAIAGWPYYGWGYSFPYSGWSYGYPYYGLYAYYGAPYEYYGHPNYRHYGYWHGGRHYAGYRGGIHTGRSVGYGTHWDGGMHR